MVSKSEAKAIKKWRNNHKNKIRYYVYHSTARHFIRIANLSDIKELDRLCQQKLKGDNNK